MILLKAVPAVIAILVLLASQAHAVDVLIRVRPWVDLREDLPQEERLKLMTFEGDIIAIEDTGHQWGTRQLKPVKDGGQYCVLRITDKTKAQAKKYAQRHLNYQTPTSMAYADRIVFKRRYRVIYNMVPQIVRDSCWNQGYFETLWPNVRGFIYDKVNGTTEDQ